MSEIPVPHEIKQQILESPYNYPTTRWAVFENQALDSASAGQRQYLAIGPENTHKEVPPQMPDGPLGLGWKYKFIGWADLGE